jgi:hypothetical protein
MANNVAGVAVGTHDGLACGHVTLAHNYVVGIAVGTHEGLTCGLTLEVYPDANIEQVNTDLVFTVFSESGVPVLDDADVEFVISGTNGTVTKTTSDYSVITFGNTLVVHMNVGDFTASETAGYTATITTALENTYTMSGELVIAVFKTVERLYGTLQNPETRVYGRLQNPAIRVIGTLQNPETRVYGTLQNPVSRLYGEVTTEVRVYGTLQNSEPRVYGTLRNPESKVCGTLQDPTTRLYGMLQEVEC